MYFVLIQEAGSIGLSDYKTSATLVYMSSFSSIMIHEMHLNYISRVSSYLTVNLYSNHENDYA
jgi:hypothetical protein